MDLEAARFLTKQFYVGAVGYTFNQLTGDTGSGATVGPYLTRIAAVGPEAGCCFLSGRCRVPEPTGLLGNCGSKSIVGLEYLARLFHRTAVRESAEDSQNNYPHAGIFFGHRRPQVTTFLITDHACTLASSRIAEWQARKFPRWSSRNAGRAWRL